MLNKRFKNPNQTRIRPLNLQKTKKSSLVPYFTAGLGIFTDAASFWQGHFGHLPPPTTNLCMLDEFALQRLSIGRFESAKLARPFWFESARFLASLAGDGDAKCFDSIMRLAPPWPGGLSFASFLSRMLRDRHFLPNLTTQELACP